MKVALALVRALRPKQWLKNVLVAAAPLSAGRLLEGDLWPLVLFAFVMFCLTSGAVYLLNDVLDREEDRIHPTKRRRPIASGALPVPLALTTSIVLFVGCLLIAAFVSPPFAAVLAVYDVLQIGYCLWLKHVAVIDLVLVSSGFLIRAVAGAVIVSIDLSQWFLLVMSFGSLFMAAGKRYSEKLHIDQSAGETRRSLQAYSLSYLRFVWSISAGLALISYALWAFELGRSAPFPWAAVSIVPFGIALLRYALVIDRGHAGAPEDAVLGDPALLAVGAIWLASFVLVIVFR